ncbi:hypothetical protein BGX34_008682 [Mortierella sp. NVP85]|nr:hypothetical protein BGX34_008682 [Mortierella sp. NVP85]
MSSRLGDWLLAVAAEMPFETDWETSLNGSWYLSPRRHTIEFLIYNVIFLYSAHYFYRRALSPGSPISQRFAAYVPPSKKSKIEITVLILLAASLLTTVCQKYVRGGMLYLLQPCHMSALMLITVLAGPKDRKWPHILLNIYFHIMWGTMLALLSPDLRDYSLVFEVENFYIGTVDETFKSASTSSMALLKGQNLNYLLVPPPGPLQAFGKWYRPAMYVFCSLLTMTRYILIEVVIQVLPRRQVSPAQLEHQDASSPSGQVKRKTL